MISTNNYRHLIASSAQLNMLRGQKSIETFFSALKQLWCCAEFTDNQLMQLLQAFNREHEGVDLDMLLGNWFASGYHKQYIDWCVPCGVATQAFQDQYISYCQQQLLNQFVRPRLSLQALLSAPLSNVAPAPAGFIFHLSRCGSTLVSGCLAEIEGTNVLSEPPAITELMLDASLDQSLQMTAVKKLLHSQYLSSPSQPQLIVKWNAWDLLRWRTIRATWPEVPVVLLMRDPVEILASHQRQAGRHMAGDPSMAHIHPVFSPSTKDGDSHGDLVVRRVGVLRELLQQLQLAVAGQNVLLVDYRELNAQKMQQIARHFRLPATVESEARIVSRMKFHSKEPGQRFQPDSTPKRASLNPSSRVYIEDQLQELYLQLLDRAG